MQLASFDLLGVVALLKLRKMPTVHWIYCISGLIGGDFNLAVWLIFIGLPNLNHAILTRTHIMN